MNIPSPKIDQRSYHDLVQQTQDLAEAYTDWQSPPSHQPDAGLALIRIFGRMASVVSDRLNRVPDRNLLAFIDLIGAQPIPPQAARVPLTFNLAEGSPADVLVPAHTQVSAPALEGEKEEVIFETEQELLVTGTQLQAMVVVEDRDYYSDRSDWLQAETISQKDAFSIFQGDHPAEHSLYIHCEEIFDLPELTSVTIAMDTDGTDSALQLEKLLHRWFYWDGTNWQSIHAVQIQAAASQVTATLSHLPKLIPVEINRTQAKWLRVDLNPYGYEHLPEIRQIQINTSIEQTHAAKACAYNAIALDVSKDFYPFGTAPSHNDTFAIVLDEQLIQPGVAVEIQTTLSHVPQHTADLELTWEIGDGQQWQPIAAVPDQETFCWSRDSSPPKFIAATAAATLQFPQTLPARKHPAESPYQIRARLTNGLYGTRGRERKYVVYNEITLTAQPITAGKREIVVDSVDELEIQDVIRIQSSLGQPRQEEARIIDKRVAEKKLILDRETRNAYEAGSRVLGKFTIAENTPDTWDPPLIQALTLTYQFTLKKPAYAYAYNDFSYCESHPVTTRLRQAAKSGDRIVYLNDVSPFVIGEFLKFADSHPEKRQIELIDRDQSLVILATPLEYDHPRSNQVMRAFHPLTPAINRSSTLYLGFNKPFSNRPQTLYLQVESPNPLEVEPSAYRGEVDINSQRLTWEYASTSGWQPLVVQDQTQALAEAGLVQFIGPTDFIPSAHCGRMLYWLRIRKAANDWGSVPFVLLYLFQWAIRFRQFNLYGFMRWLGQQVGRSADFPVPIRLRSVRTNTTWASQSITLENEILGSSNGELHQVFLTSQVPILLEPQLEVRENQLPSQEEQQEILQRAGAGAIAPIQDDMGRVEAVWVRWQEVSDFYSSGPGDRHYVVDRQTGKIQFGDGQAGMIPPRGRNNIRLKRYQTGGGIRGNRAAQTIAELKTTIPYVDSAINWETAKGGSEQESIERLKERAPQRLRHRDRTVTAQDFEDLTFEASSEVARVKVITPEMMLSDFNPLLEALWVEPDGTAASRRPIRSNQIQTLRPSIRAGQVQVIIVPYGLERQPTPTLALLNRVETFLQARLVPTMKLRVTGPKWQEIKVTAEIVPVSVTRADAVRVAVEQRIHHFLHPLNGGNQGLGWSFGRKPHHSDLYAILEAVPGVSYVRALDIQPAEAVIDQQTLVYSGRHVVTLKLLGEAD
ncbi:MAG: putative baseplate assembly protein [Synechococcales bacterium]|nr:putative baseplate assembly protein [Synechococcales bacterium]